MFGRSSEVHFYSEKEIFTFKMCVHLTTWEMFKLKRERGYRTCIQKGQRADNFTNRKFPTWRKCHLNVPNSKHNTFKHTHIHTHTHMYVHTHTWDMQIHTQALTVKLYKTKAKGKTLKNNDSTTHLTIRQGPLIIFIRGNLIELSGVQKIKQKGSNRTRRRAPW